MSEQDTTTTPDDAATAPEDTTQDAPSATETGQGDQGDAKTRKGDKDAVLADLAKERRQRQTLERRLKEIEDRDLTELQRAQKTAQEASERAEKAERAAMRQQVAMKHQLTPDLAKRLQGETEAELDADAAELAKLVTPKGPKPDPSQGSRAGNRPTDMNALLRQAAGIR